MWKKQITMIMDFWFYEFIEPKYDMKFCKEKRFHSKKWIENAKKEFLEIGNDIRKKYHRKYNSIRIKRVKVCDVSDEEKKMIRKFYVDCPHEYVVDHIFPLSKGGLHMLSNLQWIPRRLNSIKHATILPNLSEFPHCRLDLHQLFEAG